MVGRIGAESRGVMSLFGKVFVITVTLLPGWLMGCSVLRWKSE